MNKTASKKRRHPLGAADRLHANSLVEARYAGRSRIYLRFTDGLEGTWSFKRLQLNMSHMKPATIKASASGACIEVKSDWGDDVELDASSFRVLIDPEYAARVEKNLNRLARKIGL